MSLNRNAWNAFVFAFSLLLLFGLAPYALTDDAGSDEAAVKKPRVFLDKSARIVEYQLRRLSNEELLLVDRATDDAKYKPVYQAILVRPQMPRAIREEALAGLKVLEDTNSVAILLAAIGNAKADDEGAESVLADLAKLLLGQSAAELTAELPAIQAASQAESPAVRRTALAALLTVGSVDDVWKNAAGNDESLVDLLAAIPMVASDTKRAAVKDHVLALLNESRTTDVRRGVVRALAAIPSESSDVFDAAALLFGDDDLRADAVTTLLAIPRERWNAARAPQLVKEIVAVAEASPLELRTSDTFLDLMQLADELLKRVPAEQARAVRERLGALAVRVVRINTVLEEMRYDKTHFAAEAGKPIQVVLHNDDAMPHNFNIVAPGSLREVGMLGSKMQPTADGNPYQFIPDTDKLLVPGPMCQPNQRVTITFTAPTDPGEYPYVCTFPNHWFRMYGVMVVVPDLAEWEANPTKPTDPLGLTREIVKNWTIDDFGDDVLASPPPRDLIAGQGFFLEAGCNKCHKIAGQGGVVGPDLSEVFKRHKGQRRSVLTEMLDPSKVIGEDFVVHSIITLDGLVLTGLIKAQDADSISLMTNPDSCEVVKVARDDIDEMIKTNTSMMPKALLDRFTQGEILQIVAYLEAGGVVQ
ncbi:MAG: c-type cytochrome [Planctomycetales bacterium]|nr:c-type cytochrome [Planctomycetales bacterium]